MTIIRKPDPSRITIVPSIVSMKPERGNFCKGFVGVPKTGKSSTMREIVEGWRSTRIPNLKSNVEYQVIGYDPQNVFGERRDEKGNIVSPSLIDLYIELDDPDWALRLCETRNCLVILDEIKDLLEQTNGRSPKGLGRFFSQHWAKNRDIMWSVHNPILAPNSATSFSTHYYIFLTYAQEGSFKKKIPNYTLVTVASNEVNEFVAKYGKGAHKFSPEYEGQGFPHYIVDCDHQTLQAINMEKEISSQIREFIPIKK